MRSSRRSKARIAAMIACGLLLGVVAGSLHGHRYGTDPIVPSAKVSTCLLCAFLHQSARQPGLPGTTAWLVFVFVAVVPLPLIATPRLEVSPQIPRAPPLPPVV